MCWMCGACSHFPVVTRPQLSTVDPSESEKKPSKAMNVNTSSASLPSSNKVSKNLDKKQRKTGLQKLLSTSKQRNTSGPSLSLNDFLQQL
jgi:hypothetical protein